MGKIRLEFARRIRDNIWIDMAYLKRLFAFTCVLSGFKVDSKRFQPDLGPLLLLPLRSKSKQFSPFKSFISLLRNSNHDVQITCKQHWAWDTCGLAYIFRLLRHWILTASAHEHTPTSLLQSILDITTEYLPIFFLAIQKYDAL